jgi:hypothetical protein
MAQGVKGFPAAEGFGANAVGGRGGRVLEVTNLDDAGPGSLRSCLEASGPRICVFRVSGTITRKSAIHSRTPLMQHASVFDFRNNVIYNWSGNNASVFGQFALNTSAFGNVVNNLWLAGPESGYPYLNVGNGGPVRVDGSAAEAGGTKLYLSGNWGPRCPAGSDNDWVGHGVNTWDYYELNGDGSTHLVNQAQYDAVKPFTVPPVTLDAVPELLDKVLAGVGAYKPSRDAIDLRIVNSVRDKTGTSRVNTTGPWPDHALDAPAPPTDSDHDGMSDMWEIARDLDPRDARDGAALAANGYTNVENYLNELAGDSVPGAEKTSAAPAPS